MKYFVKIAMLSLCLILSSLHTIYALEDAKGNPTNPMIRGANVKTNISDKSLELSWGGEWNSGINAGISIKGRATNSIASIFSNGSLTPGGEGNFNFGFLIKNEIQDLMDRTVAEATKLMGLINDSLSTDTLERNKLISYLKYQQKKSVSALNDNDTTPIVHETTLKKLIFIQLKDYHNLNDTEEKVLESFLFYQMWRKDTTIIIDTNTNKDTIPKVEDSTLRKLIINLLEDKMYDNPSLLLQNQSSYFSPSVFNPLWVSVRVGFKSNRYWLISDSGANNASSVGLLSKKTLESPILELIINKYYTVDRLMLTLRAGIQKDNNISSLDENEVTDATKYQDTTKHLSRTIEEKKTAYSGEYYDFTNSWVGASLLWKPWVKDPFGVQVFGRFDHRANDSVNSTIRIGVGGYVLSESNAFAPILGVSVEWQNKELMKSEKERPFINNFSVNLLVSFPIGVK